MSPPKYTRFLADLISSNIDRLGQDMTDAEDKNHGIKVLESMDPYTYVELVKLLHKKGGSVCSWCSGPSLTLVAHPGYIRSSR